MGTFVQRLASRKFLLAVAAAITAVAAHQWAVAGASVVVYIAGEAHVDAKVAASQVADLAAQLAAAVAAQPAPADVAAQVAAAVAAAQPKPATLLAVPPAPFVARLEQAAPASVTIQPAAGAEGPASIVVTSTQPVTLEPSTLGDG